MPRLACTQAYLERRLRAVSSIDAQIAHLHHERAEAASEARTARRQLRQLEEQARRETGAFVPPRPALPPEAAPLLRTLEGSRDPATCAALSAFSAAHASAVTEGPGRTNPSDGFFVDLDDDMALGEHEDDEDETMAALAGHGDDDDDLHTPCGATTPRYAGTDPYLAAAASPHAGRAPPPPAPQNNLAAQDRVLAPPPPAPRSVSPTQPLAGTPPRRPRSTSVVAGSPLG